jgi:hypothetical protein
MVVASDRTLELMGWQQDLTGQVFDPLSLNMFWFELTAGAYGQINQVKATVEIVDGSAWELSFVAGGEPTETELPGERWLKGRPTRPSQIQVTGQNLDAAALMATIADCCLSDGAIENYHAQLLAQSGEV